MLASQAEDAGSIHAIRLNKKAMAIKVIALSAELLVTNNKFNF